MQIISKFQDYYDSALAFGHDDSIVFKRIQEEREIAWQEPSKIPYGLIPGAFTNELWAFPYKVIPFGFNFSVTNFSIVFCGKLYRGVRVSYFEGSKLKKASFYDLPSFHGFIAAHGVKIPKNSYRTLEQVHNEGSISRHLSQQGSEAYKEELIRDRISIMLCEQDRVSYPGNYLLIKNPQLKNYDFIKVMNPFTAYQELSMYLGGIIAPENNPMVQIEDKHRIPQHGFDKWSFRKLPEKKRGP